MGKGGEVDVRMGGGVREGDTVDTVGGLCEEGGGKEVRVMEGGQRRRVIEGRERVLCEGQR